MVAKTVLDELTEWAATTGWALQGSRDEAELLLDMLRDYVGVDDPGGLEPGHLEELLLEWYPRKVMVERRDDLAAVMPTVRELIAFLGGTKRVSAARAKDLERAVDRIEPRFPDVVMDPARWGTARSFVQAASDPRVDLSDEVDLNRRIDRHNEQLAGGPGSIEILGPDDELEGEPDQFDLKEIFGLPDRLPALRLPDEGELAASARESRLLAHAKRLASWVGERPRRLRDGKLTAADAVALARELGMEVGAQAAPADALPDMPGRPAVRRMTDLPDLVQLWELADELDFIEVGDTSAKIGDAAKDWPDAADEDVLEVWQHALADIVSYPSLTVTGRQELDFDGTGASVLVMLFLGRGDGLPLTEVREMLKEMATADLSAARVEAAWQSWVDNHGDPVDVLLGRLVELDAVDVEAEAVRLTPLSMYATRLQMLESGVEVALLPPTEAMTAADLVEVGKASTDEELSAESEAWFDRRSPEAAVDELLAVAAAGGPAERLAATSLASGVGPAGEASWRRALDEPALGPYAKIALAQLHGAEPGAVLPGLEPTLADMAWLLTDTLAGMADSLEPDELMEEFVSAVPAGQETQMFEQVWRLDHPYAHDVLMTIGRHHPEKTVAKAARKAAYKLKPPAKRR